MANLKINYCGLKLKNPIVVSSSTLTDSVEKVKKIKDAGAIALRSLMEEEIDYSISSNQDSSSLGAHSEMYNYLENYIGSNKLQEYCNFVKESKNSTDIPIIASINCTYNGKWTQYAKKIEEAGADALELNIFNMPIDENLSSSKIEENIFDIIKELKKIISIPLIVKLDSYFTNILYVVKRVVDFGVDGVVLFNKFFLSDINIKTKKTSPYSPLSTKGDFLKSLRWVNLASTRIESNYGLSGGVETHEDIIKAMMAGANVVYICSTLYKNKISYISKMVEDLNKYLDDNNISNIDSIINSISDKEDDLFERFQFLKI